MLCKMQIRNIIQPYFFFVTQWEQVSNMIGYKKNILEKQSFSEVKMGRGLLSCKLWNFFFLEECKILENLNISVHNGESENLYWVLVIFMPSGGTELKGNFVMEVSA